MQETDNNVPGGENVVEPVETPAVETEGKPVGPATIVETEPVEEQFPEHTDAA